jgi:hypothetical protein
MRTRGERVARLWRRVRSPRSVVYQCLFGHSELFNDFAYRPAAGIDFICFTDDPELRSDFWDIRLVPRGLLDPARAAKRIKALPHRFLPQYDRSLYVDNTVRLKERPDRIFERFLEPAQSPLVCFRHFERDCVYDEAEEIIRLEYDDPARVRTQMNLYRHIGYPAKNGLCKTAFLLRRHNEPALASLMERWHQQVLLYSVRDQLSLPVAAWIEDFRIERIDLDFTRNDVAQWPVIKNGVRVPRDFDDERYLRLNPDVAGQMDPRRHYLLYGAAEGRRHK